MKKRLLSIICILAMTLSLFACKNPPEETTSSITDPEESTEAAKEAISDEMSLAMLNYMPLRGILSFGGDENTARRLEQILEQLNQN